MPQAGRAATVTHWAFTHWYGAASGTRRQPRQLQLDRLLLVTTLWRSLPSTQPGEGQCIMVDQLVQFPLSSQGLGHNPSGHW